MEHPPHSETGNRWATDGTDCPLAASSAGHRLRLGAACHDAGCHRNRLALLAVLVFAKIIATAFTVESGGSGGVFAPGIVIGGLLGAVLWGLLRNVPHMPSLASFVIVGMMAFLGAVGHVPLAVMVMIAEITGSYQLLAPAMIAVGLAYVIIGNNTMYHSQVLSPAESPAHRDKYSYPLLNRMQVKEAMRTKVLTLSPDATVTDAAGLMQINGIKGIPIIDND